MNLTILQIKNLKEHPWRVFTEDQKTREILFKKQEEFNEVTAITDKIYYSTKPLITFIVSFEIAKFLAENREIHNYDFIAFHRKKPYATWSIWKEGKTMSDNLSRNLDFVFGRYNSIK